jgi:hypothetical protein
MKVKLQVALEGERVLDVHADVETVADLATLGGKLIEIVAAINKFMPDRAGLAVENIRVAKG